jgi:hypothetical protein
MLTDEPNDCRCGRRCEPSGKEESLDGLLVAGGAEGPDRNVARRDGHGRENRLPCVRRGGQLGEARPDHIHASSLGDHGHAMPFPARPSAFGSVTSVALRDARHRRHRRQGAARSIDR